MFRIAVEFRYVNRQIINKFIKYCFVFSKFLYEFIIPYDFILGNQCINTPFHLFDREEISPDILKCIMLYTMDTYNEQGQPCRHGTSAAAMRFVGSWLNQLAAVRSFPIQTQFLFGNDVTLSPDSEISQALLHGAAVVLRLFLEVPHYVLLTGISRDEVFFFDPYYEEEGTPEFDAEYYAKGIRFIYDQPKCANRAVSLERINRLSHGYYELGEFSCREALLMFRTSGECEWNA